MQDGPPATWRKSRHSTQEGGACVELASVSTAVGIRDSTNPHGHVLHMGRNVLARLLDRIKSGSLDHPSRGED